MFKVIRTPLIIASHNNQSNYFEGELEKPLIAANASIVSIGVQNTRNSSNFYASQCFAKQIKGEKTVTKGFFQVVNKEPIDIWWRAIIIVYIPDEANLNIEAQEASFQLIQVPPPYITDDNG